MRTLLGLGVYYFDSDLKKVNCINVDIISHILKNDGFSVIRALRFLRKQPFFQKIDKKKYNFWADTGTHFRCAELNHYYFEELALEEINVTVNFFGEHHGKSCRDQHFSVLNVYLEKGANLKLIKNTSDLISCYKDGQNSSNLERINNGLDPINFEVFDYQQEDEELIERKYLRIIDSTHYYHLTNEKNNSNEWVIKSTTLTGFEVSIDLEIDKKSKTNTKRNVESTDPNKHINLKDSEKPWEPKEFSMEYLTSTINTIKIKIRNEPELLFDSSFTPDKDTPPECIQSLRNNNRRKIAHCKNDVRCKVKRNYILSDIKRLDNRIGILKINQELSLHGHAASKPGAKVDARRNELVAHYEHFHN